VGHTKVRCRERLVEDNDAGAGGYGDSYGAGDCYGAGDSHGAGDSYGAGGNSYDNVPEMKNLHLNPESTPFVPTSVVAAPVASSPVVTAGGGDDW
jgi:hypothetical protein